ncbi:MAG: hypothetical protein ACM3UZ_14385 [Acidobacteriota bacterium]
MAQVIIHIKGSIDPNWSDWLSGMQITPLPDKETRLTGDLPDQAALYGVLSRLNSLGLALLSVQAEEMRNQN